MTATYEPVGAKGTAIQKLRRMVALSPTFQERASLTPAGALDRVYLRSAPSDASMPFAIIGSSPLRWTVPSGGAQNWMMPSGQMMLMLQCEPSADEDNTVDKRHEAEDFFDGVVEDIAALSAKDDPDSDDGLSHLAINGIEPDGPMMEVPEDTAAATGLFYWATWVIDWGWPS